MWDVHELDSLGLPPQDQDIVIFAVKFYLPVRWIVGNSKAFIRQDAPTAASFTELDVNRNLSLSDIFSVCVAADDHSRDSWDRSSDNPRERVHMIDFIHKIARQHLERYAELYNQYTLLVTVPLCQRVVASFRHPRGIKPKRRQQAMQQRAELLRTNVNRVMHEV